MLSKEDCKKILRICKNADFLKINSACKNNNVSSSAVYRFINGDEYDDMISEHKLQILCDEIYNSCSFIKDMYQDLDKKIA